MGNPSQHSNDRRTRRRLPWRAPVRVYAVPDSISDSFILESADLSPAGVFLHTDYLFPVGEWLNLEFVVPGRAQPVRGWGQVVRVEGGAGPPGPGVALAIHDLDAAERAALLQVGSLSTRPAL